MSETPIIGSSDGEPAREHQALRSYGTEMVLAVITLLAAVLAVGAMTLADQATVSARSAGDIAFGRPLDWFSQDLSPGDLSQRTYTTHPVSPMEYPAEVHWLALVVDVVAVWLLVILAGAVTLRLLRRARTARA